MLLLLFGGAKAAAAACTPAFQNNAFQFNAFQVCKAPPAGKKLGWMPEWGFRHDPEDLERRLKAQRESVFNPRWLDRFLVAEEKTRRRIGKAKTAAHRSALEEAVEQVGARIGEAIDAGALAPTALILELEAAANATRASASLKHALRAIEMAQVLLLDDEEVLLLDIE